MISAGARIKYRVNTCLVGGSLERRQTYNPNAMVSPDTAVTLEGKNTGLLLVSPTRTIWTFTGKSDVAIPAALVASGSKAVSGSTVPVGMTAASAAPMGSIIERTVETRMVSELGGEGRRRAASWLYIKM